MSKCPECEEGLAEWVMSYADMITILMAFFVVMYSMAGSNKNGSDEREQAVMRSLRDRFGPNWLGIMGLWPSHAGKGGVGIPQLAGAEGEARASRSGGKRGTATGSDRSRAEIVAKTPQSPLGGVLYFPVGSVTITRQHEQQVKLAAEELAGKPQRVEIRGHTSRRPVGAEESRGDAWDVAYARCRAAMGELVRAGIEPRRIRLGVAADNEPVDGGRDAAAINQSSRVEIFMLDEFIDGPLERPMPKSPAGNGKT